MRYLFLLGSLLTATMVIARPQVANEGTEAVSIDAPIFVLNHVRVIDGTGASAKEDQAVVIANGKIVSIGPVGSVPIPQGAQKFDRSGYTVMPRLVGMPGKQADLLLIKGDPSTNIDDIENVETVFKAGIGFDSKKLVDSVRGQVGIR